MLRLESETGWWLITHVDHARLAGAFAERWGNSKFATPEPRNNVLLGVRVHDDGWAQRDARPSITRQGKPAAFSVELVGKYSAFEEIDLADYLAVRERAVWEVAARDAYAALLVSMHTYNLLTARADRSTIAPEQLPLLDDFLIRQKALQDDLRTSIRSDATFRASDVRDEALVDNFRLLQATDNLSLLACVDYGSPTTLLHSLRRVDGGHDEIAVTPLGDRRLRLQPYPFMEEITTIQFPARHVKGKTFVTTEELQERLAASPVQKIGVTLVS